MGAYEGRTGRANIKLPELEAVVGNPPYVRHEEIPKESELKRSLRDQSKEHIYQTAEKPWPDLKLSKQSDLHVYFWPVAAQFLREDGWFGFLTSSSWLDARYGFALQRWILQNFRLVAVIESVDEPWFEDARVENEIRRRHLVRPITTNLSYLFFENCFFNSFSYAFSTVFVAALEAVLRG